MTYAINWTKKAAKQLLKITPFQRGRIVDAVGTLADFENAGNVKALTNHTYGYRLRVGNYRVLFDADAAVRIVEIQEVNKRDSNTY